MLLISLLVCGLFVGLISSFFGVGGGSLMVPLLYTLFENIPAPIVISTSLCTIFSITVINNIRFYKNNFKISSRSILLIFLGTLIGSFIGSKLIYKIPTESLKTFLGVILLLIALKAVFISVKSTSIEQEIKRYKLFITALLGAFLASLTGLGGGVLFVPLLIKYVKAPIKKISPISNFIMMFSSLFGFFPNLFIQSSFSFSHDWLNKLTIGQVNFSVVFIFLIGGILTSTFGVKYNNTISDRKKSYLLAILLLILAFKILVF